ncbi:MAG: hypothetical protein Aurels2KO_05980 [Aureliella sp.]
MNENPFSTEASKVTTPGKTPVPYLLMAILSCVLGLAAFVPPLLVVIRLLGSTDQMPRTFDLGVVILWTGCGLSLMFSAWLWCHSRALWATIVMLSSTTAFFVGPRLLLYLPPSW